MKKTIWKFPVETTDIQTVEMPTGAEILCVQVQNGIPCIWAMVPLNFATNDHIRIEIYGTGHSIPDATRKYIGTYQIDRLVFHVFQSY